MSYPPISSSYGYEKNIDKNLNMWPIFGLDFISPNYEFTLDLTYNLLTSPVYNHDWCLSPNLRVIDFDGPLEFPSNLFPKYKKRSLSFPLKFERRSIYEPTIIATKNAFNETVYYALPSSYSVDCMAILIELFSNGIKNANAVLHYLCFGVSYQSSYFRENKKRELEDKSKKYNKNTRVANIAIHFMELDDPRRDQTKHHKLLDIIVIAICAIVGGADHWTEMESFGKSKHEWFKSFLELPNGIPSHDTFRRVFILMDPEQFKKCAFVGSIN